MRAVERLAGARVTAAIGRIGDALEEAAAGEIAVERRDDAVVVSGRRGRLLRHPALRWVGLLGRR